MRILVVEDNQKLAGYIKDTLEQNSFAVDCVYDGLEGEKNAIVNEYDLIVLDIMLPGKDGISVCKTLREKDVNVPIIMLTARGELEDKILGLDSGSDDYLVKPFELKELIARIRALLRRPQVSNPVVLKAQDIFIDNSSHIVNQAGNEISLTLKEYCVLEYLMLNKNQVINREQILEHCWDQSFDSFSNIVDVYIKQLRKKLNDSDEKYIKTIRGLGYQFQD
jgi:DNA-binding response OmpR family regulator